MQTPERDCWASLARVFDPDLPLAVLDIGANIGQTAARVLEVFPHAQIDAFEPAAGPFESVAQLARQDPRVRAHRLALGASPGEVNLRVSENALLSSVLPPTERAQAYFGGAVQTSAVERVEMTTVDAFCTRHRLRPSVLKIDVQGLELEVLRGATQTLRSCDAIAAEAQIYPEYQGAATLWEIEPFLRERGFVLHRVNDLWHQGPEQQASCLDGLWLSERALRRLRTASNPERAFEAAWCEQTEQAVRRALHTRAGGVALAGGGYHTRVVLPRLLEAGLAVRLVLDDAPDTNNLHGLPAKPFASAAEACREAAVTAVVVSSNRHEAALAERATQALPGLPVFRVYADDPAAASPGQPSKEQRPNRKGRAAEASGRGGIRTPEG